MNTVVIQIGNRFFYKFGKGGRVQTAWHLAGATLFMWDFTNYELDEIKKKLNAKGVEFSVRTIEIVGQV